jgi:CheY-like chemotaxis protein
MRLPRGECLLLIPRAPTILLIDDDDADRMTLGRMLKESGYRVMAVNRGADALHTFVIHHLHIPLVLARTGLSDFTIPDLCDALFRIDRRVQIVMAGQHAYASENGLDEATRRGAFAETLAEVRHRLQERTLQGTTTPAANYFRSSANSSIRLDSPDDGDDLDAIRDVGDDPRYLLPRDLRDRRDQHDRRHGLASAGRHDLLTIRNSDPRNSLARWERARRRQLRRVGRLGLMAAAICTVLFTALMSLRTTPARAIEPEVAAAVPLSSSAITGRIGTVHLVPSARVRSSNFADDLTSLTSRSRQTSPQPSRRARR